MLWRYREAIRNAGATRIDLLTALAGAGYFIVWIALGIIVFPPGFALAETLMQAPVLARAVPVTAGAVLLVAGAVQFTGWKIHHLACCRRTPLPGSIAPADVRTALRYGVRLGLHCGQCCINLMAILLVLGVMDLPVMAAVTAGITLERLLPQSEEARRLVGIVVIGAGLAIIYKVSLIN
jgi:predicted metal-binding membrane protein